MSKPQLTPKELAKLGAALHRLTLVLKSGREVPGTVLTDRIKALQTRLETHGTPAGTAFRFALHKGYALKAIRELRKDDPDNSWVQEMERRLTDATTPAQLDQLLKDEDEGDWIQGYINARMEQWAEELDHSPEQSPIGKDPKEPPQEEREDKTP